ncbi:hypothetical protein [Marinobacter sp. ANT_B65]|uniref:hypothetical protein n=1 Tax=Marinobacter sp. ANT_B65 TaxID=2039467 RepID=UPI001D0D199E|nr:hypothetical protein [Marinobacter sp. ANT_B65]
MVQFVEVGLAVDQGEYGFVGLWITEVPLPAALQGDKLVCAAPPDTITGGSVSVSINGKAIDWTGDSSISACFFAHLLGAIVSEF